MLPLKNDRRLRKTPFLTVIIVLVNLFVFGFELSLPPAEFREFISTWGFTPRVMSEVNFTRGFLTIFSSMFIHGGLLHVAGNMLYLWIFGGSIEEKLGPFRFLTFYLLAGMAGALSQYFIFPTSQMPMIGASGAVAGVLGAYMVLFPESRILTAVLFFYIIRLVYLPAWFLLGFWVFIQFMHGLLSLGVAASGGVAWFAHIGGFFAGVFLVKILKKP